MEVPSKTNANFYSTYIFDEGRQNSVSHALEDQYKYMFTLGVVDARRLFIELEAPFQTRSLRFVDGRQQGKLLQIAKLTESEF